jgi:cystathionine gamma-synthase
MPKELLSTPPGSAAVGAPIPVDFHALSVSLPTWQDNVYWAEGSAIVVDKMETGYPRFFVNRRIQKVSVALLYVITSLLNE